MFERAWIRWVIQGAHVQEGMDSGGDSDSCLRGRLSNAVQPQLQAGKAASCMEPPAGGESSRGAVGLRTLICACLLTCIDAGPCAMLPGREGKRLGLPVHAHAQC